jgi:prevent-host-death family protein
MSRSRSTKKVNIAEAKATLSDLIEAVLAGGEVVIARRNVPVARLVAVESAKVTPRFGSLAGRVRTSDDFDAPLEDFAGYRE